MGASAWSYYVPYQSDINKAFLELKEEIFHKGEYYTEANFMNQIEKVMQERLPPESFRRFQERKAQLQNQPPPPTIQELKKMNGDQGTHSIIDMDEVSKTNGFGKITILSPESLIGYFDTEKPTREMTENKEHEILEKCERWQGFYIIVYQNNVPREILFIGISGD